MSDLELCYMSAREALQRFRARTLSPVELMQAVIARAQAVEPVINAFTFTHFDEALDLARKAEARYLKTDGRLRPLEGLPVGIKDESDIAGKPTSGGSLTLKDHVGEATAIPNERVLKAGAIVHARTATPEFSCAVYTHSTLWGVTRNPWNPDYTPGGSSGGTAASLASGTSTLATGSDIAGSIRNPAGVCGVAGFKPPYGRNPQAPPFNFDFYCHGGPLARTVSDCALFQNVMAGPHPGDVASLRPKLRLPEIHEPIRGWKIAYSVDLGFFEVDDDVRRNMMEALDVFASLGATVEEVDLGWTHEVLDAALVYLEHLFGASLAPVLDESADLLTPYAREFAEKGRHSKATDFVASLEVAGNMYKTLGPILQKHHLLICPTNALPAVPAEFDHSRDKLTINGRNVNPMLGWVMTTPFNMMSRCPVLSVPSGRASNGVPTGIQIVGRTYRDQDVFRAASAYEAIKPWYVDVGSRPNL